MERRSNKLRLVSRVENYIVSTIDSSQEVKRLCKYLNESPMSSMVFDEKNNKILQPDITGSLKDDILIPFLFDEKILTEEKVKIFVYNTFSNLDGNFGDTKYTIEVIVPNKYNKLVDNEERVMSIAYEIIDLLDKFYINSDDTELNGIDLTVNGSAVLGRPTDTSNYIGFRFDVTANKMSNMRSCY